MVPFEDLRLPDCDLLDDIIFEKLESAVEFATSLQLSHVFAQWPGQHFLSSASPAVRASASADLGIQRLRTTMS